MNDTARAAHAITVIVWGLSVVGVVRRYRAGRPVLALAALAYAPVVTFFMTNYGGEAAYRVYFFSIPWIALLVASAVSPDEHAPGRRGILAVGVTMVVLVGLLVPAYFGDDEVYQITPGEVAAAQYFYNTAPDGSVLMLSAPNFPSRVGGRYDRYLALKSEVDPNLLQYPQLGDNQVLGKQSIPALDEIVQTFIRAKPRSVYVVFAASGTASAYAYNLARPGSLQRLQAAVASAPEWRTVFTDSDTTIYRYVPTSKARS